LFALFLFSFSKNLIVNNKNKTHQTKIFNFQINKQINEEIIIGAKKNRKKPRHFPSFFFLYWWKLYSLYQKLLEKKKNKREFEFWILQDAVAN